MSFLNALDRIKQIWETDATLDAYCQAQWGKSLTVRIEFTERAEINAEDMPIVLLTAPSVSREKDTYRKITGTHQVNAYAGFMQHNKETGARQLVSFEEALQAALLTDRTLSGHADSVGPLSTRNDEGSWAPQYFMLASFNVKTIA